MKRIRVELVMSIFVITKRVTKNILDENTWSRTAYHILTPVIEGERFFQNCHCTTKELLLNSEKMTAKIVRKPGILGGRPTIAGTRVSVSQIAGYVANGYGTADIQKDLPHLTSAQITAALHYLDDQANKEIQNLAKASI